MLSITNTIPVVNIHIDNLIEFWPALTLAIRSSTFIALDLEMSGIGSRKDTMTRSTEDRYKAFCEIAKTRSVLSLGISLFQTRTKSRSEENTQKDDKENSDFVVQTFNVMVLSKDSFIVEPSSLKFLVEHGFDFNKHYAKGITYCRKLTEESNGNSSYTVSNLFLEILRASKPVVFHNGILDLVFLYQNFYADLPSTSLTFLADLSEMFPAGVFDTKYVAEYHTDYPATYLNYVFKKSWRLNVKDEANYKSCVTVESCNYPTTADVSYTNLAKSTLSISCPPCEQYAAHGHCPKGMKCEMSHDIDVILDHELKKKEKKKKRKRKRKDNKQSSTETKNEESEIKNSNLSDEGTLINKEKLVTNTTDCINSASGNHRAGFDAFMTGFTMAVFINRFGKSPALSVGENLPDFVNKLNLSGKNVPLKITKSQYSKTSTAHSNMWKKVMSS